MMRCLLPLVLLMLAACDRPAPTVERVVVDLGVAEGCDAAVQPCQLSRDGIHLELALGKNVRTMQPFPLQLRVDGVEHQTIQEVVVEFFMEGMAMGVNRYRLLPDAKGWHGEITLPICVAGRSDWRAAVEVRGRERRYHALFRFHSSG